MVRIFNHTEVNKRISRSLHCIARGDKDMIYESNRLNSFKNRHLKKMKPESLAAAGFFYVQEGDYAACAFCSSHFAPLNDPLKWHIEKSPRCPFLVGYDFCGNVPLLKQELMTAEELGRAVKQLLFSDVKGQKDQKPKLPNMSSVKRRLLTFAKELKNVPEHEVMAECGFFFTGIGDIVCCFFCGGYLNDWRRSDNPWEEHAKFFKECAFLAHIAHSHNAGEPTGTAGSTATVQAGGSCKTQSLATQDILSPIKDVMSGSPPEDLSGSSPEDTSLSFTSTPPQLKMKKRSRPDEAYRILTQAKKNENSAYAEYLALKLESFEPKTRNDLIHKFNNLIYEAEKAKLTSEPIAIQKFESEVVHCFVMDENPL